MKYLLSAIVVVSACTLCGQIKDKVYRYMPLKQDLSVIHPDGARNMNVYFKRGSTAMTPDFKKANMNQPRFWKGGLLMEPGGKFADRGTVNVIPGKVDPFDKSGAKVRKINGYTDAAFHFNGKVVLKPVPLNIRKKYIGTAFIFSFYAKGSGTLKVTPTGKRKDGTVRAYPALNIQLTKDWKRHYAAISGGAVRKENTFIDTFSAVLEGNDAAIDAVMLESPAGYFGIQSPTTYVPNGAYRDADRLKLPGLPAEMGYEGAISFSMTLMSGGGWQSLLTIGPGYWVNDLEMSYRSYYGGRIMLDRFRNLKNQVIPLKMKIGDTHHIILSYDRNTVSIYIDGKKVYSKAAAGTPFKNNSVFFGGRTIQVHSGMLYRHLTIFKKALTDAEAAELAKDPDLESRLSSVKLRPASPFSVFPVNSGVATVRFKATSAIKSAVAKIDAYPIVKARITSDTDIICNFDPAKLMPGKYDLNLTCKFADGSSDTIRFPLEICNALRPKSNLQIWSWNENGPDHSKFGITMGSGALDTLSMDNAARNGTYATHNMYYTGTPRPGYAEDRALDYRGKPTYPRPRSKHIQKDMIRKGQEIAAQVKDSPTFLGIVLNSESHQGSAGAPGGYDYSPEEQKIAKSFGVDLNRWLPSGKWAEKTWYYFHPLGNLAVSPVPDMVPKDRSIPADNPLYAYHLERHGPKGGTDVVLNDLVAKEILKVRPDVLVTQDPILRRPYLRSYREISNAADWCYYVELHTVVNLAERLGAVTRGLPKMSATTMPQFLFKGGMVAPYPGLPPADMFRAASYLAVSRPTRVLTFWNVGAAIKKGKQQTASEIEALIGGRKNYKETAQIIKQKKLQIFCFDPALGPELKRLSSELWYPFGALIPKWRNAPRKIAVVRSFASDLFGNVRWPGTFNKELPTAVTQLGLPYDVLYDEDLSKDLSQYDMILIPVASALPEAGVKNLLNFRKKGGKVVVDERCRVTALADSIVLKMNKGKDKEYEAKAKDLLARSKGNVNTPLYIEGMQALQEAQAAKSRFPALPALVKKHVKTDFVCNNNSVFWNHLQADGADYLFAVNDLRIPGPIYGRFGKVREKGLPQTVSFLVRNPRFRYAYDMMTRKQLPIRNGKITFELGPCAGKIILFTSKAIGSLTLNCNRSIEQGGNLRADIRIGNGTGMIPVLIEIYDAAGKKLSISCSDVVVNGRLKREWTIPVNAPAGRWKIAIRELAKGQTKTVTFNVTK